MSDITTRLLTEIRDGLGDVNQRLDQTNQRLDGAIERLDRLERRQVETEIRLATELTSVVGAIRDLKDAVLADRHLRADVEDHERRIRALERGKRRTS
ncbi:MAG: hypothetical protein U0414_04525 [Polyangiaceae bacterium]